MTKLSMRAARLSTFLLSVDLDVCMRACVYVCVSASLRPNISETKGDSGLFPIARLKESAQGESNDHVTR